MPCVTAHAFIEDIRRAVSARVLSIIQETNGYIMRNHPRVDCVGLLATDGTLKADVFAPLRSRYTLLLPSPNQQRDIMSAVYGPSGIKTVGVNDAAASVLKEAAMSLVARGAQVVIAGCTEIPLALRAGAGSVPTLDTLEILAEAIVREARKQNDEAYGSRKPLSAM
jgi:aspartate racemase